MKQSEQLEKEESTFLSLCSPHDRDLLAGRTEMRLRDFERITYITMALDYIQYTIALHRRYIELTDKLSEQLDREREIAKDYPDYYLDEQVEEKHQKWLDDFCNHIPADKQKYYRELLKSNDEYM